MGRAQLGEPPPEGSGRVLPAPMGRHLTEFFLECFLRRQYYPSGS
jgi:hypothetical protein